MLLEKIRQATAENHQKLEDQLFPFISSISNNDQYALLLKAFYGYIFPVQEKIAAHIDTRIVPDMQQRRNASFINDDLQSLGQQTGDEMSPAIPVINDHATAIGALYVMEGSTLGGKIISKMIAEKLGSEEALRFFKGYGPETGMMWKNFIQYLDHPGHAENADTIVHAASETFRLFGTWLEEYLPVTNKA